MIPGVGKEPEPASASIVQHCTGNSTSSERAPAGSGTGCVVRHARGIPATRPRAITGLRGADGACHSGPATPDGQDPRDQQSHQHDQSVGIGKEAGEKRDQGRGEQACNDQEGNVHGDARAWEGLALDAQVPICVEKHLRSAVPARVSARRGPVGRLLRPVGEDTLHSCAVTPVANCPVDPVELAAAAGIVFVAYLVRGVSGFGSALVAVPLLAQILPLTFVVPWVAAMDVLAALALTRSGRKSGYVRWAEIGWLVPAAVLGILVGLQLLVRVEREPLLVSLGVLVTAFGVRQLLGLHGDRPVSRWWALPAGVLGGGIGAVFATGGPPFVIYLTHRLPDKSVLRATLSGLFLIEGSLRLLALLLAGLFLQQGMGIYLLAGVPLMAAGLWTGHHIHVGLSQRQMAVAIAVLLIGSGLSLVGRVFQAS